MAHQIRMSEPLILSEATRPFAMIHSPKRDPLPEEIASALKRRGLHTVAFTLLEAGQPLTFAVGQMLWLTQPALSLLWPSLPVQQFAKLLEDPNKVNELMACLAAEEVRL